MAPFRASECGLKQNEICELGMIVDTSQEKLTGPVDVSLSDDLIYNELHQGLLQGTRLIRKKPNRPSSQWLQACEIAGYETGIL